MTDATDAGPETTTDAFLGGALMLRQPKRGFRSGLDGVLLAAACRCRAGGVVLDCGAGAGVVGLCVARRVAGVRAVLVEREPPMADLARSNVALNGLEAAVEVVTLDLMQSLRASPIAERAGSFHHVLANPPYRDAERGTRSDIALKDAANAMPQGTIDRWARFMAAMAAPGGTGMMIHLAEALPEVLDAFGGRFGDLSVLSIQPRAQEPASRVLIWGTKGSAAPLRLLPPLVLHPEVGNGFRPEIEAVLRGGAALPVVG